MPSSSLVIALPHVRSMCECVYVYTCTYLCARTFYTRLVRAFVCLTVCVCVMRVCMCAHVCLWCVLNCVYICMRKYVSVCVCVSLNR
jgi:hypothetical protein